ncbi:hypothetical protein [Priestia flexa]|uniref:hypothetical protein n=1 Tax=Priestia flexa TaxID=86664 RepID=UPI00099B731C|nr:hypothetical protein [Priestia flexa]AQX56627.1 hypothetical protein BC359_20690 [Priestia flexa]
MYCDKLINIAQHSDSAKYNIDYEVIQKLDSFIKEKTTFRERENLNPVKFSIEMKIKQEISLMSFVLGTHCKLFKMRAYFNCSYCDEHLEIFDVNDKFECTCGKMITPSEHRDKLFLYFKLLETPAVCSWEENTPTYQLDFFEKVNDGKGNFTLADLDNVAGKRYSNDLISLRNRRDKNLKSYIKGEPGFEGT